MRPDGQVVWVSGGTTLLRENGERVLHSVMEDVTDAQAGRRGPHREREPVPHPDRVDPGGRLPGRHRGPGHLRQPAVGRDHPHGRRRRPPTTRPWPRCTPTTTTGWPRACSACCATAACTGTSTASSTATASCAGSATRARPTLDEEGAVTGIIGSLEDVTELVAAQEQNARLAEIVETTSDLVGITDGRHGQARLPEPVGPGDVRVRRPRHHRACRRAALLPARASPIYQREILAHAAPGRALDRRAAHVRRADGTEILVWQVDDARSCGPTDRSTRSRPSVAT